MKRLLVTLTAILMIGTSQASTNLSGNEPYGSLIVTATQPRTAIRNVPVHVKSPRVPKFKILRGNPYRISHILIDDSDDDFIDDEGIMTPYRRRDLTKIEHPDNLSEKVRWRLFLARQLALMKYRAKFG